MELILAREPAGVPLEVDAFLAERVERNVLATVLAGARAGRYAATGQLIGWCPATEGGVGAAVLRTPPHPLLCSELAPAEAPELLGRWLDADPQTPGVSATLPTARALAEAWGARTGRRAALRMAEAVHVLERVTEPARPAAGSLREARSGDLPLLSRWESEFAQEAGVVGPADAERIVAARLTAGTQLVWEDGEPVCTVCFWPAVGGTARIGPVYTPAQRRARGYARAPWRRRRGGCSTRGRAAACCSPTSPTRPPTASMRASASAAARTGSGTTSLRREAWGGAQAAMPAS